MNHIELKNSVKFILSNLDRSRIVVEHVYKIKNSLIEFTLSGGINERDFYKITSLLTPQSRSPLWQNYFIQKYQCKKIPSKFDKGDFEKNGKFYEFKASGFNQDNGLHIVQLRLWQDCDYIIQSISDQGAVTFLLTHEQMEHETELLNAANAHGTQSAVENNENIELRMTIEIGSATWSRWMNLYNSNNPLP